MTLKISYFSNIKDKRTPAEDLTRDLFLNVIQSDQLAANVDRIRQLIAEGRQQEASQLKAELPAVTWQAYSRDGSHKQEHMVPNSLYMLDVDHVDDPQGLWLHAMSLICGRDISDWQTCLQTLQDPECIAAVQRVGIALSHITPSGHGLRVVAWRVNPLLTTIAANQAWLADQLGISTFDTGCTDFSRLAFLSPAKDFLYLDEGLWDREDTMPFESSFLTHTPAATTYSGVAVQEREYTDEVKTFAYNGHSISEIAQRWVDAHGTPQQGERHNYYVRMALLFRTICDNNVAVMLCHLPSFGLDVTEREKVITHACKKPSNGEHAYDLYAFLQQQGFLPADTSAAEEDDQETPTPATPIPLAKTPPLPPVFKEFCSLYPPEFHYPAIVAIATVLGAVATSLRSTYLDGNEHSTSFISMIYAPASSMKSYIRNIHSILVKHLRKHDRIAEDKETLYKRELKAKKNSDILPEDPHVAYRLVPPITSVPKLLARQQDACGLHQLSFSEEVDTYTKSNRGASYAQKSDLYRIAFDNAEYGQDYMSTDTFSGSVPHLRLNLLMLGTPNALYRFFNDPEDGLVSRTCFAELAGQEFAPIPVFKKLTEAQQQTIDDVLDRFEAMTYRKKSDIDDEYAVLPPVNIDDKMEFLRKPLNDWLNKERFASLEACNISRDIFRRRSAVKAFRVGMICVGMYDELTPAQKHRIKRFVLWFADRDLYEVEKAFGPKLRQQLEGTNASNDKLTSIFDELGEQFSTSDITQVLRRNNRAGGPSYYIGLWTKAGLVQRTSKSTYAKVKKSKKS